VEDETGIVRSEIHLDMDIVSNIIYMIISITNLFFVLLFNFIFPNAEQILKNSLTTRKSLADLEYGRFNGIISNSLIKAIRVSCSTMCELLIFRTIYSLSHIPPFNQPVSITSKFAKTLHKGLCTAPALSALSS
jgi:hypothetical protein